MVKKLMKVKKVLTIGKRIIETHGGTIDAHSSLGFGTKIAIFLPVKRGIKT